MIMDQPVLQDCESHCTTLLGLQGITLSSPVQPGILNKGSNGEASPAAPLQWDPQSPSSVPPSLTPIVERMLKVTYLPLCFALRCMMLCCTSKLLPEQFVELKEW